ncbi:hypothetical protein FRC10_011076 [Ceratobasidium sp. 414]|nr:hypothetical protein FRC10_011076 [Ceratobasidium sp. 414]
MPVILVLHCVEYLPLALVLVIEIQAPDLHLTVKCDSKQAPPGSKDMAFTGLLHLVSMYEIGGKVSMDGSYGQKLVSDMGIIDVGLERNRVARHVKLYNIANVVSDYISEPVAQTWHVSKGVGSNSTDRTSVRRFQRKRDVGHWETSAKATLDRIGEGGSGGKVHESWPEIRMRRSEYEVWADVLVYYYAFFVVMKHATFFSLLSAIVVEF